MMRVAHADSDAGVVGRQMKILRRLGVSPGPSSIERSRDAQRPNVRETGRVERVERASVGLHPPGVLARAPRSTKATPTMCAPSRDRDARLQLRVVLIRPREPRVDALSVEVSPAASPPRRMIATRSPSIVNSTSCGYSRPRVWSTLVRTSDARRLVFGVHRKRVAHDRAADGAERLPLHVLILRIVLAEA